MSNGYGYGYGQLFASDVPSAFEGASDPRKMTPAERAAVTKLGNEFVENVGGDGVWLLISGQFTSGNGEKSTESKVKEMLRRAFGYPKSEGADLALNVLLNSPGGSLDGYPPPWPTKVLLECAESERVTSVRSSAAVLLAALHDCFPQQFADILPARTLESIRKQTVEAPGSVSDDYLSLADKIRTDWGTASKPLSPFAARFGLALASRPAGPDMPSGLANAQRDSSPARLSGRARRQLQRPAPAPPRRDMAHGLSVGILRTFDTRSAIGVGTDCHQVRQSSVQADGNADGGGHDVRLGHREPRRLASAVGTVTVLLAMGMITMGIVILFIAAWIACAMVAFPNHTLWILLLWSIPILCMVPMLIWMRRHYNDEQHGFTLPRPRQLSHLSRHQRRAALKLLRWLCRQIATARRAVVPQPQQRVYHLVQRTSLSHQDLLSPISLPVELVTAWSGRITSSAPTHGTNDPVRRDQWGCQGALGRAKARSRAVLEPGECHESY